MRTRLRTPSPAQDGDEKRRLEEWLYHRKEDTVTDEFRRYSVAGSAIPVIGVLKSVVEQ